MTDNPKQAAGRAKPPMSAVPMTVLWELALALAEGGRKYGKHNFRVVGEICASDYFDALFRHMTAWWEGEDVDPDSGLSHLVKAMATLVVLRDSQICGTFADDRPPRPPADWFDKIREQFAAIVERHPVPRQSFIQK